MFFDSWESTAEVRTAVEFAGGRWGAKESTGGTGWMSEGAGVMWRWKRYFATESTWAVFWRLWICKIERAAGFRKFH